MDGYKDKKKVVMDKFIHRFKKLIKRSKLIFVCLIGAASVFGSVYSVVKLQKKNRSEYVKNERDGALTAIELTLELSKTIEEFYNLDNKQHAIIQSKNRFSEISFRLKSLSNAKINSQFITTVRKTSEFFNSYCDHQIDLLNKTEAMKLDLSINDHVDTAKVERLLNDKSKYGSQANQLQNEILRAIPKAFTEWEKVLSPEDCHLIFSYIDENFTPEKKKLSEEKEKKGESKLYLHEWIAMQINEEVFNRWMEKELGDILSKFSSVSSREQEIDNE